jgi:outer membrane protein
MRTLVLFALAATCSVAQQQRTGIPVIRWYQAPEIPPLRLSNSARLASVMRAGKMYLTLSDTIALAIENNLNLEADRYGPLLAEWALKRAEAGGPIRGVPSASAQVSSVNNGVGVNGSTASAGLGNFNTGNNGGAGGGASIQQIGAITPNLDPILQNTTTFSHLTQPQANTVVSQTNALVQVQHTYSSTFQQGLLSGGYIQIRDYEQYLRENAPSDALNPALGPHIDLILRHNLLQGFGNRLNGRSIRIARMNIEAADDTLRSQLVDTVSAVINLYEDLVADNEVLKARLTAVEDARRFYDETESRIKIGSLAKIELPRAAAERAAREQDLLIAQSTVRQQETVLKEALVRSPDPAVDAAEIVPLDRIEIPEKDDLPPLRELLATALAKRPDVAATRIGVKTQELSALGTENPLLPTVQVNAQIYNRGVAGKPQPSGGAVDPYFVGGYGKALGQIFRRNFPSEQGGAYLSLPIGNRQAQGDYGADQLQLRQSQVRGKRDTNQIMVDISNQVIALRQARARYSAAVDSRELQQALLKAEQQKFAFGRATITGIIVAQRALVAAQTSEVAALTSYAHARVSLDQVLGRTLEANHVSLDVLTRDALKPDVQNGTP